MIGGTLWGVPAGLKALLRWSQQPEFAPDAKDGSIGIKLESLTKTDEDIYALEARVINIAVGSDAEIYAQGYFYLEDKNRKIISSRIRFSINKPGTDGNGQDYLLPGEDQLFKETFFGVTGKPAYVVYTDNTPVYADKPIRVPVSVID
jgi:hypothetical protein